MRPPLCTEHIIRDWNRAVEESCTERLIQRCFVRALQRDENGDVDKTLIPKSILEWYDRSDNESDSSSEEDSSSEDSSSQEESSSEAESD